VESQSRSIPTVEQKQLAKELGIDPIIIMLLNKRSITVKEDIVDFLNPSLTSLPFPADFKGVPEAVSLIVNTIATENEIVVWGDYDVDGITGTALLIQFFRAIGRQVKSHIPDRLTDGYGLNSKSLSRLRKTVSGENPLLITVDCGISNHEEILLARKLGYSVLVTDHHELPHIPVKADVVVNPKANGTKEDFYNLAGVGVAFYLAAGLRAELQSKNFFQKNNISIPNMKEFLCFVALGTIADMVPLVGVNRILVKAGFEALMATQFHGISALLSSCDIHKGFLTADDIGFSIAPKINAAGRIGKAETALELLVSENKEKSIRLAAKLTRLNIKRKKITGEVFEKAKYLSRTLLNSGDHCIVIKGEFHQGVIGIVASKLVEKFNVPVLLFSQELDENNRKILKGSARSIEGVNLFSILQNCDKYIINYGGHQMAAGLTIFDENFSGFKAAINSLIGVATKGKRTKSQFWVDLNVPVEELFSSVIIDQLRLLEPYGEGNQQPIFQDKNSEPIQMTTVGIGGHHIKIRFRGKFNNQNGIGFGLGNQISELRENRTHSIIYSPMLNRFKNSLTWQVKILSIQ